MAPKLDPEYSIMLSTPASLNRPHKEAIESLEKQIDFYIGEANRLRYTRNSHVAVSRLPAELLSEMFLRVVESNLRGGDTYFAPGTFNFLLVCRRWNEVAVGFPLLWGLWIAGAVKAWPLFNSRSKGGPVSLMWQYRLPNSAQDILTDPTISRRIHQLDFSGDSNQLDCILSAFDLSHPSNVSSIRLQIDMYDEEPQERLTRFLSSPFPKLSKLNIGNFLPNFSSPVFTTSKLTSLKLFLPYEEKGRYTLDQFSQILQRHPTLQKLDLNHGAIPLPRTSGTLAPFVLSRLVDLRLHGTEGAIFRFIDLIGMSSPLHNVVIHFGRIPDSTAPVLASIMEKILVAYYNCQGLDHPRRIDSLTVSLRSKERLVFDARSHSTPMSNLKLRFPWGGGLVWHRAVEGAFAFFPSKDIREFTIEELPLTGTMLQKMKDLSHLHLCGHDNQNIWHALGTLSLGNQAEPNWHSALKLESLTLSHIEFFYSRWRRLLDVLEERYDRNLGLKNLVVRSCRVHEEVIGSQFRKLVENVEWDDVREVDSELGLYEEVLSGPCSEESDGPDDDADACETYHKYPLSD